MATVNGKPQLKEALGWGVCGQVLNHTEASGPRFHICWGPESLVPVITLTPAALMAGDAIGEALFTATTMSLWSDPGLCWAEALVPGRGCCTRFLAHTFFLLFEQILLLGPWPQLPAFF